LIYFVLQAYRQISNFVSGTIPECVINELREKKLGLKEPEDNGAKSNDLMSGNFDVVKEMIAAYPEAKMCKLQVDKLIDAAGGPPLGKGCENLRELIAFDKMKFDVAGDDFTAFLKKKIVDQIGRYATLIAFAMYCKENNKKNVVRTAVVQDAAGSYQCNECGYQKYIGHFKQHRKSTHEGVHHSCDQCDYKATSKSHLTSHVKSIHEGVHYPCDQCDYKATRTRYLHSHQLTNHN